MEEYLNKIICMDCVEFMKLLPANCVDLVVTSPPYDDLRDYEGYSFNFEETAKGLYKVIKEGGVVVWVVADKVKDGSETGTSFRQALYFKEIGFNIHDTMIYLKDAPRIKESNRYRQMFEYMFVFSKGKPKTFNPIKRKNIYNSAVKKSSQRLKEGTLSKFEHTINEESEYSNVWQYSVGFMKTTADKIAYQHPAMFPEELADDHILSWSNVGDVVFDPFCGSGTVPKKCKERGRNFLACDISEKYCKISEERLKHIVEYMFKEERAK